MGLSVNQTGIRVSRIQVRWQGDIHRSFYVILNTVNRSNIIFYKKKLRTNFLYLYLEVWSLSQRKHPQSVLDREATYMLYGKVISLCSEDHKKHQVGKIYDFFSTLERVAHRPIITTVEEVKFRDTFRFTFSFPEENNSRFHAGEV